MQSYNVTPRNLFGNACADRLAELGSKEAEVLLQDVYNVKWHYALVRRIQARAVVILSSVLQRSSTLVKPPKRPRVVEWKSETMVISTQHRFTSMTRTLHCDRCLKHSDASEKGRKLFLASPCIENKEMTRSIAIGNTKPVSIENKGNVQVGRLRVHIEHELCIFKGLYYCTKCGYHASAKMQKLAGKCDQRGPAAIKRVISLRKGKLPSGLRVWPNDLMKHANIMQVVDDDGA